ncbi:hypothetical protein [Vibrio splendidus]|uniref:hypothetical protein n=1 Tax=Vibrio splendidus TaxID=29497 RepID=UPI001F53B9E6|nr:hypothetical protein [Vibrio splendidus]
MGKMTGDITPKKNVLNATNHQPVMREMGTPIALMTAVQIAMSNPSSEAVNPL